MPHVAVAFRFVVYALFCAAVGAPARTLALDATSPEVQALVARAVAYLEITAEKDQGPGLRLGSEALLGRAMLFAGKPDHPRVSAAVDYILQTIKQPPDGDPALIYSLGIAVVFLCELDAERHRVEIDALLKLLTDRQKSHGGWGYANRPTGDTSMTQYAVFALWTADQAGIKIADDGVWMRAMHWLLRTQDIGGGWGYQGVVPDEPGRVAQPDVRRSLTEAALASLYLCGEHFGVWRFEPSQELNVSNLLKRVDEAPRKTPSGDFDLAGFKAAFILGNAWLKKAGEPIFEEYPYYHLYTIERFQTFRLASGDATERTLWYDQGVDYLQTVGRQAADGHWTGKHAVADTSFAVLFLLRSTRATLKKESDAIGAGTLVGGRGLPTPAVAVRPRTTPTSPGTTAPDAELTALLKQLDDPKFVASLAELERVDPSDDKRPPNPLTQRLMTLAQSNTPEAKAAALRALGRLHDLDQVPVLIEAIGDPEPLVHQAAVDALRFLSRRHEEYGRPVNAEAAARGAEAKRWTEWYRTIRPSGR